MNCARLPGIGAMIAFLASAAVAQTAPAPVPADPQPTIIRSKGPLRMENNGTEAYFVFTDEVVLTGTNLEVTCDKLEVFAVRKAQEPDREATIGSIQGIRRILATGHVAIRQEGRRATAGVVEVLPDEEKIVLSESPEITDPSGTMRGKRMTIYRGTQQAEIEEPELTARALPNLGFPQQQQPAPATPDTAVPPATPPAPSP